MLDYFVQQDCNLTQIGGLLDSKVSQNLGLGLGFSLGEIVILVLRWAWLCNTILLQDSNFEILIKTNKEISLALATLKQLQLIPIGLF